MIKDREIAMVNAASKALEIMDNSPDADTEDIIKYVMASLDAPSELKIQGIAAANEIIKMRRAYRELTDKQVLQLFVDNIFEFISRMGPGNSSDLK